MLLSFIGCHALKCQARENLDEVLVKQPRWPSREQESSRSIAVPLLFSLVAFVHKQRKFIS